jgi:uncharacterized protein
VTAGVSSTVNIDSTGGAMSSGLQVRDNSENSSYEGVVDGEVVGLVVYKRLGDRVVIRHTAIAPEFRGAGLGTDLVRAVLDDLRRRGQKLTNYCGFVADFIETNIDYQDLVDRNHAGVTLPRDKRGKGGDAPALYQ